MIPHSTAKEMISSLNRSSASSLQIILSELCSLNPFISSRIPISAFLSYITIIALSPGKVKGFPLGNPYNKDKKTMASGKTHDKITWISGGAITAALLASYPANPILVGFFGASYLFAGFMFGPDLDTNSIQLKRWGLLKFIWIPYKNSIRHRSPLSHGFLSGTAIRVLYLGTIICVLVGLAGHLPALAKLLGDNMPIVFSSLAGMEAGAMSHTVADLISSSWKKKRK